MKDIGISSDRFAFISTALNITFALLALPIGILADRSKRVRVLSFSMVAFSVSYMLIGFCRSYEEFLFVRIVNTAFKCAITVCSISLLFDFISNRSRNTIFAVFCLAASAGGAAAYTLSGIILHHGSKDAWRNVCWIFGAAGIIFLAIVMFLKEPERSDGCCVSDDKTHIGSQTSFFGCLKSPGLLIVLCSWLIAICGTSAISQWFFAFIERYFSPSGVDNTYKLLSYNATAMLVSIIAGSVLVDILSRRFRQASLYCMAVGLFAGAVCDFLFFNSSHLIIFLFASSVLFTSFISSVFSVFLLSGAGPYHRAKMYGFFLLLSALISEPIGMFVTGVLSDKYHLQVALSVMPAFMIIGAIGFFFAARLMKRSDERHKELCI